MLRFISILFFFNYSIYANTLDINALQEEFIKEVIELNVFKKRYDKYLNKRCADDIVCLEKFIENLKKWDTVQNDNSLDKIYKSKTKLLENDQLYWEKLQLKLQEKNLDLKHSQFVSVIDLDKQFLILTLWDQSSKYYHYIGKDFISTGDMEREAEVKYGEDHYMKTPSGIFRDQGGWRSDGEYNKDNITKGYGSKDRFVFYFGTQPTVRYNTFDKNGTKITDSTKWKLITDEMEFAAHSHISTKPMGQPFSHGCIRMTDEMNRFMDTNLILHKNKLKNKKWIYPYTKPPAELKNHHLAGEYLIIFNKI